MSANVQEHQERFLSKILDRRESGQQVVAEGVCCTHLTWKKKAVIGQSVPWLPQEWDCLGVGFLGHRVVFFSPSF